jgi:hypothetical protein
MTEKKLFDVPNGVRVRIKSKLIKWIEGRKETIIGSDLYYEAETTNRFEYYKGKRRRLLVNHNLDFWYRYGIWQIDTTCERLNNARSEAE